MVRWRQVASGLGLFVALQLVAWGIYHMVETNRGEQSAVAGFEYEPMTGSTPASDLLMERADGQSVRLSDYSGNAVLLHFWATWCVPCRTELPRLMALADTLEQQSPVRVVLVSVDEDWATIRHFFDGDVPARVLRDGAAQAKWAYDVTTLPDTYVLRQGLLTAARIRGARDWGSASASAQLRQLLGLREEAGE